MDATTARRMVQAAAWRTHLAEIDAETTPAFEAWLSEDAGNPTAWRQAQETWDLFGELANSPELIELRRTALGQAQAVGRRRWLRGPRGTNTIRRAIAAVIAVLTIGATVIWSLNRSEDFRTATGERRIVTLSDGSNIALDSQSEVLIKYSDTSRELKLVHGQARFDVAHDVERPFSVLAGDQKVVAVGTAFNINLFDHKVLVTLIEGRVIVLPRAITPAPIGSAVTEPAARQLELKAGEQLVAAHHTVPTIARVNVGRATAWQNGRLVFESEALASVIQRVNRYTAHSLEIADAQTGSLEISGVFNTGDVAGFVTTVTQYLPVQAETRPDGTIVLRQK